MCRIGSFGVVFLAAVVVFPAVAAGQPRAQSLGELAGVVTPDQRVTVTLRDGTRLRGRVASVEPQQLVLQSGKGRRELPDGEIREVRKRGDRLWNGALMGAAGGAVGGGLIGRSQCYGSDITFCGGVGALIGLGLGAVAGLSLDALWPHADLLYARREAPAAAPVDPTATAIDAGGGTLVGRSVDRAHGLEPRRALTVSPVLSKDRRGVTVVYAF